MTKHPIQNVTQPTNPPVTQPTNPPVTQPTNPPVTQPTDPVTPESLKKGLVLDITLLMEMQRTKVEIISMKTLMELYKLTTDQRGTPNSAYHLDGELGYLSISSFSNHKNTADKGTISFCFKLHPVEPMVCIPRARSWKWCKWNIIIDIRQWCN